MPGNRVGTCRSGGEMVVKADDSRDWDTRYKIDPDENIRTVHER